MLFRPLAFLCTIAAATATPEELSIDSEISASSPIGRSLLSKARALENGNGNFAWVSGYSIKFEKCASSSDYYAGQFYGGNGGGNGENRNRYGGMYEQRLVHFKLCPSDSCSSCSKGGDYVIDLNEFVQAVIQSKVQAREYECEQERTRCEYSCQNANDDETCKYQCFANGKSYCNENQGGNNNNRNGNYQEQFNLEEAMECRRLEVDKDALQYYMYNNGGNKNNQYMYYGNGGNGEMGLFAGPYCSSNGKKILLGVFMDEMCSYPADKNMVSKFGLDNYLPYQTESLVAGGCISCKEPQEYDGQNYQNYNQNGQGGQGNNQGYNYNWDDRQDADEVTETCERLYEASGKCETNVQSAYYPNTYACDFIKSLKASGSSMKTSRSVNVTPKVFASLFAVTTVIFGGMAYMLHQKVAKGGDVSLTGNEEGQMA